MARAEEGGGQWIGRLMSNTAALGWAVVELDPQGGGLRGKAYQFPDDPKVPAVFVELDLPNGAVGRHRIENSTVRLFHPLRGEVFGFDQLPNFFPDSFADAAIDLLFEFDGDRIVFEFMGLLTSGGGSLQRVRDGAAPEPADEVMSWAEFAALEWQAGAGQIFRGQSAPHRLKTSFHRSSRGDLVRYRFSDIPEIHRALACQLSHFFDLDRPEHTGAFYSLIQHHGYPTPLLDWTYSPFVAAFFAFEKADGTSDYVRIFQFDRDAWIADNPQIGLVTFTGPHFSMLDCLSLQNNRQVPQQATAALTNVEDIESYLQFHELVRGKKYLKRIDIPSSERDAALAHLRLMGITAGSLFPGLDGTCRSLAAKNF